jgi:hypothetical protein
MSEGEPRLIRSQPTFIVGPGDFIPNVEQNLR